MTSLHIRPFGLADIPAIDALYEWAWWPRRSRAGWAWLMEGPDGAARRAPAGWVAVRDGEIVAAIGNHAMTLVQGDDSVLAATGHSLVVRPDAKGVSRPLLKRFSEQAVFSAFTVNANRLSSGHYRFFEMHAWPPAQSAVKYAWWIDPLVLVGERLMWRLGRLKRFKGIREGGERGMSPRLWNPAPLVLEPAVQQVALDAIDDRFDRFWDRLRAEGRLMAVRNRAALAWRVADPDLTVPPVLLAWTVKGEIRGYILAFFAKQTELDRPTLEIIDLVALDADEARAIPALLRSLIRSARGLGVARVRLSQVNPRLEPLVAATPGARRLTAHVHAHFRFADEAAKKRSADWYLTPFDGDYSYCIRPPPLCRFLSTSRHGPCVDGLRTVSGASNWINAERNPQTLPP